MKDILNEVIVTPNGGGTVYVNEVVEIGDSSYAICTPLVHTDNEEIKQEISKIKDQYGDITVIYIYRVKRDLSGSVLFESPNTENLHELISRIKEMEDRKSVV